MEFLTSLLNSMPGAAAVVLAGASLEAAASPCWALEPQPANRLADMAAATVSAKTRVRFFIV